MEGVQQMQDVLIPKEVVHVNVMLVILGMVSLVLVMNS